MPDQAEFLEHLLVIARAENRDFTRTGRGAQKVRSVNRASHGQRILNEAAEALSSRPDELAELDPELMALGTVITIEGADGFELKLESLEQHSKHKSGSRPKWLLLSVQPADALQPEQAQVWVSDEYRAKFLELFERYVNEEHAMSGKPKNAALVANIARIRTSALRDLWQSSGEPPTAIRVWWEIWLRPELEAIDLARRYAETLGLHIAPNSLSFDSRLVVWIEARWSDLSTLPFSAVPVSEIRRPAIVDTVEDLTQDEQYEYADDLLARVTHAKAQAPAVCLLDTGVRGTHSLLQPSIRSSDMFTVVTDSPSDQDGHGTKMAGLALLGPLDELLTSSQPASLLHGLESVKIIPASSSSMHDPDMYGLVTA